MHGRDVSMNQVAMAWQRVYGASAMWWEEASELIHDMRGGCVIPVRYEPVRKGGVEEAVEVVLCKADGTLVKRVRDKKGAVVDQELSPRDVARVIGEVTGYADALEALDA